MYKALCVAALLVGLLALTGRSSSATPTPFTGPLIVAKGKLVNQTTTINKTVFTPTQDGLYRLSMYATISTPDPASQSIWYVAPAWTDDWGAEGASDILAKGGNSPGQFQLYGQNYGLGGVTFPVEAKAGTPITIAVNQSGPTDNSAYSLYYTLERLE